MMPLYTQSQIITRARTIAQDNNTPSGVSSTRAGEFVDSAYSLVLSLENPRVVRINCAQLLGDSPIELTAEQVALAGTLGYRIASIERMFVYQDPAWVAPYPSGLSTSGSGTEIEIVSMARARALHANPPAMTSAQSVRPQVVGLEPRGATTLTSETGLGLWNALFYPASGDPDNRFVAYADVVLRPAALGANEYPDTTPEGIQAMIGIVAMKMATALNRDDLVPVAADEIPQRLRAKVLEELAAGWPQAPAPRPSAGVQGG